LFILSSTEEYVRNRLDDQIKWYSEKSAFNKSRYRLFQVVIIVASGTIPILNLTATAFMDDAQHAALFTSSILGSIITIITAFSQMEKYFETWILYRTTVETLKREKFLYINNAADYSNLGDTEKNRLLVERVEVLLSSENSKFFALQQQQQQQQQASQQQQRPSSEEQKEKKDLSDVSPKISSLSDSVVKALSGISFPKNRQDILNHIEQNKGKIENADSVIKTISVLPARDYISLQDFENELLR
jgi:hypothetical protein